MKQNISYFITIVFCFFLNSCGFNADSIKSEIKINNDFLKTIMDRASVRSYKSQEVNDDSILKMLEFVNRAPSAGNLQAYKIIVVKDKEIIRMLGDAALKQNSVYTAPHLFVFIALPDVSAAKYKNRGRKLYALQDATIAAAYSQLVIKNYGYDSVWVGAFSTDEVSHVLKLKDNEIPIALIPFGISDERSEQKTIRKPIEKMVEFIQ